MVCVWIVVILLILTLLQELFYLLADSSDDGVVTTSALAVELQAGGLTEEHVEFVSDLSDHGDTVCIG